MCVRDPPRQPRPAGPAQAQTAGAPEVGFSSIPFQFFPPGARSLAMGATFIGVADDATAAASNPAGLIILTKPEASVHGRFTHFSELADGGYSSPSVSQWSASYASLVVPEEAVLVLGLLPGGLADPPRASLRRQRDRSRTDPDVVLAAPPHRHAALRHRALGCRARGRPALAGRDRGPTPDAPRLPERQRHPPRRSPTTPRPTPPTRTSSSARARW